VNLEVLAAFLIRKTKAIREYQADRTVHRAVKESRTRRFLWRTRTDGAAERHRRGTIFGQGF